MGEGWRGEGLGNDLRWRERVWSDLVKQARTARRGNLNLFLSHNSIHTGSLDGSLELEMETLPTTAATATKATKPAATEGIESMLLASLLVLFRRVQGVLSRIELLSLLRVRQHLQWSRERS